MKITKVSLISGKEHTLEIPVTIEQLAKWQMGGLIQNVMPHLPPHQREFLMTGITEEEWNELFKESEEDE